MGLISEDKVITKAPFRRCRITIGKTMYEVFAAWAALGPINQSVYSSEGVHCYVLDHEAVDIKIRLKVTRGTRSYSTRNDFSKVGV